MITVSHSITGFNFRTGAARYPRAVMAGTKRVGYMLDDQVKREVDKTYARPIPTRRAVARFRKTGVVSRRGRATGGQKAWARSGALKRGRGVQFPSRWSAVVAIRNTQAARPIKNYGGGYAQRLHDNKPLHPSMGISRQNRYFAEAARKVGPKIGSAFQEAFDAGMKG